MIRRTLGIKYWILFLGLFVGDRISAQLLVDGVVYDEQNEPLPYVSVYQKNTSNATLTNDAGFFSLELQEQSPLIVQYLGYTTEVLPFNGLGQGLEIRLKVEEFEINTVEIVANAEDPAYEIIRKTRKQKQNLVQTNQTFIADQYVKGVMALRDTPERIFGQEVGDLDGILDSNRQGIIYLSETLSTFYRNKKETKEILHSSIVSGDDNGIGFNQFMSNSIDFYDDITMFRKMIGPLDDASFSYYKFKLEASSVDNEGRLIHKIHVIPKSEYRPCFGGYLYIVDGDFCIHSLDLFTTGRAMKTEFFDTLGIKQVFAEVEKGEWKMITSSLQGIIKMMMFEAEMDFHSVWTNYNLNPEFPKGTFGDVLFEADEDAIQNDSAYWNKTRPIALTESEKKDYAKKDSLSEIWESKTYLDSVDRVSNSFKWMNVLTGYSFDNSYKGITWKIAPSATNFNAVEGYNLNLATSYNKAYKKDNSFNVRIAGRYGFSDKKLKPLLEIKHSYNNKSLSQWGIRIGREMKDYSPDYQIMADISNSWHSLIYKQNYLKWFQRDIVDLHWEGEIANGLQWDNTLTWQHRQSLNNNTNLSWFTKDKDYDPNNPYELPEGLWDLNDKKLSWKTSLTWSPRQKIMVYPQDIVRMPSGLPIVQVDAEYAAPVTSDFVSFAKLEVSVKDEYFGFGRLGHLSYMVKSGVFLKKGASFPDVFHFVGQEVIPRFIHKYNNSYRLLPYYILDNENPYVSTFSQYHLDGLVMDKIPLLNRLGWKFVITLNGLFREDIQYLEPGIGLEGIRVGPFDLFRLDYYWGGDQNGYRNKGLRLGFVNFFSRD